MEVKNNIQYQDKNCLVATKLIDTPNNGEIKLEPSTIIIEKEFAKGKKDIKNLILSNCLTEIGQYSFTNSTIESVKGASCISKIGEGAFFNCKNLTEFEFSTMPTIIEMGAFSETKLKKVFIPNAKIIEKDAFAETKIETACIISRVPGSIIGEHAFAFSPIKELELYGISNINANAFAYTSLNTVHIQSGVTYISPDAFSGAGVPNNIIIHQDPKKFINHKNQSFYDRFRYCIRFEPELTLDDLLNMKMPINKINNIMNANNIER